MKKLLRASILGIIVAVNAAGAGFVPVVYADTTENAGQYMSNSVLTGKVKAALLNTKGIDSNDINVTTVGGVVTLSGVVDHAAQVELAGRVAAQVGGVKQVQNNLKSAD